MLKIQVCTLFWAIALVLTGGVANAETTATASVDGRVAEVAGTPIVGATIRIDGLSVLSDANGRFRLTGLGAGWHGLTITADRHRAYSRELNLSAGGNPLAAIALEPEAVTLGTVNVTSTRTAGQVQFDKKAASESLTESVSGEALKNPNSQSSSDLVKDVSGVAVSKGANGSSTVSVRGIDQRMLRFTVDGQRQAGTANPLDSIPPEIVQSLEVTKTFTPDMESDAVGGVININTGGNVIKERYEQGRHQLNYNTLAPNPGSRNSFTLGVPFSLLAAKRNASVLATVNFDDQYSLRERLSALREWTAQRSPGPDPFTDTEVPVLTLPLIEATNEHRQRSGLVLNADARFAPVVLYFRSNLNRDLAKRNRNINDTDPASGTPLSLTPTAATFAGVPLSRRNQHLTSDRGVLNVSFGGKSTIGTSDIDLNLAYAVTREDQPDARETVFQSDSTYRVSYDLAPNSYKPVYTQVNEDNPDDLARASDPAHYRFNYLSVGDGRLMDQDGSAKLNLKYRLNDNGDYLKLGGKAQQLRRSANTDRANYDPGAELLTMSSVVGRDQVSLETADYRFGPVPSARAVNRLLASMPGSFQLNDTQTQINSTTGDYTVNETLWAGYGMGKFIFGRWSLLAGLRVEGTQVDSSAYQMQLDDAGQLQGFDYVRAHNDYAELLPGLHLRYEPAAGLLYRASVTRSQSRPSTADIAPFRTLSFVDHRSRIGSPELKPYLATNFDLSVDKYDDRYGLVSFGVFYKKIDHFITDAQYPVTIGNLGEFIEFKRINGEAATAIGAELGWQSPGWALPLSLGRGSLEANTSINHGEAHFPQRPGETFSLPRQVDHQASLKLHELRGPLSVDFGLNYRSGWFEDLIAPGFDNYIVSAWDAELSAAYRIGKNTRITAGFSNLLNQATRHYAGSPSRMNDWQRSGVDMNLGVQWKL